MWKEIVLGLPQKETLMDTVAQISVCCNRSPTHTHKTCLFTESWYIERAQQFSCIYEVLIYVPSEGKSRVHTFRITGSRHSITFRLGCSPPHRCENNPTFFHQQAMTKTRNFISLRFAYQSEIFLGSPKMHLLELG